MLSQYQGFLGAAYLWVKAAHVTFVIFWIEDRQWIEREDRARTIILTPAMLVVWVLGLMLAVHLNIFSQGWFAAKLALVVVLSAYQGWITSYGRKLANGHRSLDDKRLRMMNEVPGILTALIVVLVIVRPF